MQEITVEMLLQHSSGLPRYIANPDLWKTLKENPDKVWTYKERLAHVFHWKAVHKAGKGFAYSDTNYLLLGMLAEKLCGNDYYDEVNKRILLPYKLKDTYPAITREIKGLPQGYCGNPKQFNVPERVVADGKYCFNPQMEWTGGGFASTTADLARWAKIYYEGKLFSESLLQKIVSISPNGKHVMGTASYGTGSIIYETEMGEIYGHSGFVPGFRSIFAYYPKQKVAVGMQFNCDFADQNLSLTAYLDRILVDFPMSKK